MPSRPAVSATKLFSSLVYGVLGIALPWYLYPGLRPIQILMPYVFALAAGLTLGRFVRPGSGT